MTRQLTAHEVLRLVPSLPGSEVRAFYEQASGSVQVLFVGVMIEHELDPWELGLVFRLAPALDGNYEPAHLVNYPAFRWQGPAARAFGAGLGAAVRAWAIEAYESHLSDQEYRLETWLRRPEATRRDETVRTLEQVRRIREEFQAKVAGG